MSGRPIDEPRTHFPRRHACLTPVQGGVTPPPPWTPWPPHMDPLPSGNGVFPLLVLVTFFLDQTNRFFGIFWSVLRSFTVFSFTLLGYLMLKRVLLSYHWLILGYSRILMGFNCIKMDLNHFLNRFFWFFWSVLRSFTGFSSTLLGYLTLERFFLLSYHRLIGLFRA